jgi:uncharacterized protein YecE (DUF72 family)
VSGEREMLAEIVAPVLVGTAGWSITRNERPLFPGEGTHLERYARVLPVAEINSSFYRPLRPELYAKWAASVPHGFRFSVKVPKAITHELRLLDCERPLADFLDQAAALGDRLGCLLVQLPPSFEYDASLAGAFLAVLRALHDGPVVMEPRHETWFTAEAERVLEEFDVGRVAADPARVPAAGRPGAAPGIAYFRLHGSPRIYWSRYDDAFIDALATQVLAARRSAREVWCIFDNTASSSALPNALELVERIRTNDRRPDG